MDTPPSGRDELGRFAPGNPGGPGRPKGHGNSLRRAVGEAVSADHLAAIMRRATRMALEGNLNAMRFVVERTCGRAPEPPPEGNVVDLVLPNLRTAAGCSIAIDRLVEALCQGTCDREAAKILIEAIQTRLKAIETTELEARLAELEKTTSTVLDRQP